MGAIVIAAAAAGAGAWLAPVGYAALGASLGWSIGSALAPKPTQQISNTQPQLTDLRVTGSEYGQPIPWIKGTVGIAGQMWWNTDRRASSTTTVTESGGGKGGGGGTQTTTTTTTYDMDCLIGLSDNAAIGLRRIWNNGKLVWTNASDALTGSVTASEDTNLWTRMTFYPGSTSQLPDPTYEAAVTTAEACAYRGRSYVFIAGLKLGQSGQVPNLTFEVVADGSEAGLATAWSARSSVNNTWEAVTYAKGLFVAVAYSGTANQVMTSPDGITWTARTSAANNVWHSIAYGNGVFVAVAITGTGNRVMTSPDGITWTARTSAADNDWRAVTYGNGLFVAVASTGTGNRVMTSPDGITWTIRTSAADNSWFAITYGAGVFVAVAITGVGNRVMTSTDGITWTIRVSAEDNSWSGVAFGASTFVAVAADGTNRVMTSSDGITWATRSAAAANGWFAVTFGSDVFIAVSNTGTSNRVMSSSDGITWTIRTSASDQSWRSVVYGGGMFVAIAETGAAANSVMTLQYGPITSAAPSVQSVQSDICLRAGLTAAQIDVTGLSSITRTVRSLAWSQISSARSITELMMSTYFYEMVTSDKIYFRPRGSASVATIPYADLGASASDDQPEPFALRKANELEVPAQIALTYINVSDDYQNDTQYSDRLISSASGTVATVQMAIGMTPAEAKGVADVMLLDQTVGAVTAPISLLGDYCRLEPTDPITVTDADGVTFRMRIVKKNDSFPLLGFEAVLDDVSILTSQEITSADYAPETTVDPPVNTYLTLLDIPILRDADDDAGFYVATKGDGTPYPGSAVFYSSDDVEYTRKATVLESAVFGMCTTTLGNWTGSRMFDEVNTVTVDVGSGTLSSSTRAAVLDNLSTNAILIGDEIIQFLTATLVSAGIYTLSRLLRGCRGTEWAMTGHAANERAVRLSTDGLRRVLLQNNELGLSLYYKGVTLGRALSSATAQQFTNTAIGRKPFSPIIFKAGRDSSNNITFEWQRRTRLAVRMIGSAGISAPLGEDSEAYEIDVYSNSGYTTIVRTISATTTSASYTAAQQTTDGLTPGNTVYCKIYQISEQVGRGYVLQKAA